MSTIANIIERVLLNLEGYTGDTDIYGTLESDISSTDLNFTVLGAAYADGSGFSTGLVEIGTELVYVQNIDRTTGEFSGVLRGFRGTTTTDWPAGTRVRNNPRFPISSVYNSIVDTINSLYPRLCAIKKTEFTGISSRVQYDLPEDTLSVISVNWLPTGTTKAWMPVHQWKFNNFGGSNAGSSKTLNIIAPANGRKVQVVYYAEPKAPEYSDTVIDIGFPSYAEEVIIYGACWRLASFIDSSRVSQITAEQALINSTGDARSNSSGTSLAKYFLGMYEQQLNNAQQRQSREYPTTKHRTV